MPLDLMPNPRGFAKRLASRKIADSIRQVCEALGPVRLGWLISTGTPLRTTLPEGQEPQVRRFFAQWGWMAAHFTDEEIVMMFPADVRALVARHGERGQVWLRDLSQWIREMCDARAHSQ